MLYTYAIYMGVSMTIAITTVFTNNRTQAVRMPAEARLPDEVKKVIVRIRGRERIITPIENTWDNFFMNGPTVTEEFLNERGVQLVSKRESL
jgi:antitoxin VapB